MQNPTLGALPYIIVTTDDQSIVRTLNSTTQKLLKNYFKELVNTDTPVIIHGPGEILQRLESELNGQYSDNKSDVELLLSEACRDNLFKEKFIYGCKNGSKFPVFLSLTTLYDEQGKNFGFLLIEEGFIQ